ncbi:SCP2 sterol-binding domain-containing protein [Salinibius halmophilus]|uniref:SCP2 sterol-binding domain-containing protein n=1 Tax=Salinibius halmophilus TaxID=1853216 RepID=UPI000E66BC65|nr:SCP2 sterol-binding domain-containing protein [Salinibius halmophilus]
MDIQHWLATLPQRLRTEASKDLTAVFQFQVDDWAAWVAINNTHASGETGYHESPDVTLTASLETFKALGKGRLSGMTAVMQGKLKVKGSLPLASRLPELFTLNELE